MKFLDSNGLKVVLRKIKNEIDEVKKQIGGGY